MNRKIGLGLLSILVLLPIIPIEGSERQYEYLGCEWLIEDHFIERGSDALSENSWYSRKPNSFKSIIFFKGIFDYEKHVEDYEFVSETTLGPVTIYKFNAVAEDERQDFIKAAIVSNRDDTGYISIMNFSSDELSKFTSACTDNAAAR